MPKQKQKILNPISKLQLFLSLQVHIHILSLGARFASESYTHILSLGAAFVCESYTHTLSLGAAFVHIHSLPR